MSKKEPKYPGCWYADNLIDYPDHQALIHLDFPRCIVIVRNLEDYEYSDYDEFRNNIADIQWLDPSEKWSDEEKESTIIKLWNFSIEQEREEERLWEENNGYSDDDLL